MSPTLQMTAPATYTPTADAMDRHEYGIAKNRKPASTGGGRAWSDDEEVYLLQTRLQKMPYKHIAAHLKKTELACRLHYHQLSHGSNRRKRTTSVSSGSSGGGHSPVLPAAVPSPIHERATPTPSPPGSAGSSVGPGGYGLGHGHGHGLGLGHGYGPAGLGLGHTPLASGGVQLPSILSATASAAAADGDSVSPRLPTILPKPVAMPPHSAPLLPAATFTSNIAAATAATAATTSSSAAASPRPPATAPSGPGTHGGTPSLRLDCSGLPPAAALSSAGPCHPVDMARLHAAYAAHRGAFWAAVAAEYGPGSNPVVLEQAWRTSGPAVGGGVVPHPGHSHAAPAPAPAPAPSHTQHQTATPLTPGTSPDDRDGFYGAKGAQDKTRIAAILGIDANPRSPKEREMVRRLEEERVVPAA